MVMSYREDKMESDYLIMFERQQLLCKAWRDFSDTGNTGIDWGKEYIKILFVKLQ